MQLEQASPETSWSGTVPSAVDLRVVGVVVVTGGLAASLNVPYGGMVMAIAAFVALVGGGIVAHLLGERKLRRITDGLVERWVEAGGHVEEVTRSSDGMRTEWIVHTPDGEITIGGLALVPIARLTVEWQGVGDTMDASEAETHLDALADSLYEEIFEIGSATKR
ncbi:hypothetical protein RBH26_12255 [Natronolimnohabitans sp. A-GB9]|uniref:hypothetical protein n=1 Tax=Natronolimnohabitans sp. A-GB9 TaxID=3069757 RepID=UPI0027B3C716|nr:hypothetical protein [Natronolimnohabitans sp. A-GB9]MDQ2051251.1 hypothetical protein [Natronolimnohabitans sp. A-GB9]